MHIWQIWHTCKASQPVVNTFDYPQLLRRELGIWNGSWERPGYHSSCISMGGGVITKDGTHIVSIGICGYCILLNTCARRRRRDKHDVKIKSNKVSMVQAHSQGSFLLMNPSIFQPCLTLVVSGSLTLIDSFAWVWIKQGNLHVNRWQFVYFYKWKTFPARCKKMCWQTELRQEILKDIGIQADWKDITLTM